MDPCSRLAPTRRRNADARRTRRNQFYENTETADAPDIDRRTLVPCNHDRIAETADIGSDLDRRRRILRE